MITNKQVLEQGQIVEHYPIDQNPFTGEQESNGGVENLVIYGDKVYSVLTDFTGSVPYPNDEPTLITDDANAFMQEMFFFDEDDISEMLEEEAEAQWDMDVEDWELREKTVDRLGRDWDRNDD